MSFLKRLFSNVLNNPMSGHHGNKDYSKHGGGSHGYQASQQSYPPQANNSFLQNICPSCTTANNTQALFCQQCGSSLGPANCTKCNQPLAADAKFCGQCGKAR